MAGHEREKLRCDDTLTPRGVEILGLVARSLSNRDIATRLVLSEKSVRNQDEHTYANIGATNRVGASQRTPAGAGRAGRRTSTKWTAQLEVWSR